MAPSVAPSAGLLGCVASQPARRAPAALRGGGAGAGAGCQRVRGAGRRGARACGAAAPAGPQGVLCPMLCSCPTHTHCFRLFRVVLLLWRGRWGPRTSTDQRGRLLASAFPLAAAPGGRAGGASSWASFLGRVGAAEAARRADVGASRGPAAPLIHKLTCKLCLVSRRADTKVRGRAQATNS